MEDDTRLSLFERSIFSIFDQYDQEKQKEFVDKLMKRSGNTYYKSLGDETTIDERKLSNLREIANKKGKSTSIAYLSEIQARKVHILFSESSRPGVKNQYYRKSWGVKFFLSVLENSRCCISLSGENGKSNVKLLNDFLFEDEDVFNSKLEEFGLPPFYFDPIYTEDEWYFYLMMFTQPKRTKEEYLVFRKNFLWLKENAKCVITKSRYHKTSKVYVDDKFIKDYELEHYKMNKKEIWSFFDVFGLSSGIKYMSLCQNTGHDQRDVLFLAIILLEDHKSFLKKVNDYSRTNIID